MKKYAVAVLIFGILSCHLVYGVTPKKWELQRMEQFLRGKFNGISVSYEGVLSLSPREEALEGPSEDFYLSMLTAPDGSLFTGTGHSGKLYRIDPQGKSELYFQAPEMDIYCLARDSRGNIYAGTSPNGRIYKVTSQGQHEEFFRPQGSKYIWDLVFTKNGHLLAAVGEQGGIIEISPEGEKIGEFDVEENHILCMAVAENGDIYAGSGGKGRLYRVSRERKAAILFESPFEEIRAIVLDGSGGIYAAAGGLEAKTSLQTAAPRTTDQTGTDVSITVTPSGTSSGSSLPSSSQKQPGALFKLNSEGIAKLLWKSDEDMIYSLLWDPQDEKIVFGTGNRGRIFVIDKEENPSLLLQKTSEQIYSLHAEDSKIYLLANNPVSLSILYPEQSYNGEYVSRIFDAAVPSSWGRAEWRGINPQGTVVQVLTRSGNASEPNQTWSDWSPPYQRTEGEQILSPGGRYLQFKIQLKADSGRVSPQVDRISLFYLQANLAPVISSLEILPPNVVFLEPPVTDDRIWGLDSGSLKEALARSQSNSFSMAKRAERKGYRTVVWQASDENGDALVYSISARQVGENRWRPLKNQLSIPLYTFETLALPDGEYQVKLEASDLPSNPVGRENRAEKISRVMTVDNSLPSFADFSARRQGSILKVAFSAEDSFSRIKQVQFLIRPDEWHSVFPDDGICDSKQEKFEFTIQLPEGYDNILIVRVEDEQGNTGVHRVSF